MICERESGIIETEKDYTNSAYFIFPLPRAKPNFRDFRGSLRISQRSASITSFVYKKGFELGASIILSISPYFEMQTNQNQARLSPIYCKLETLKDE